MWTRARTWWSCWCRSWRERNAHRIWNAPPKELAPIWIKAFHITQATETILHCQRIRFSVLIPSSLDPNTSLQQLLRIISRAPVYLLQLTPLYNFSIAEETSNTAPAQATLPPGIPNLLFSCYINAIVQALACIPQFRMMIVSATNDLTASRLLKTIFMGMDQRIPICGPVKDLIGFMVKKNPLFSGYTQEDAQEFLQALLNVLADELFIPYEKITLGENMIDGKVCI